MMNQPSDSVEVTKPDPRHVNGGETCSGTPSTALENLLADATAKLRNWLDSKPQGADRRQGNIPQKLVNKALHGMLDAARSRDLGVERNIQQNVTGELTDQLPILRLRMPIYKQRSNREEPYVLRGRDEEFSLLANRIVHMPHPIITIEGAPGTGKTSLLKAAGTYARQQNFAMITLGSAEFETPATFASSAIEMLCQSNNIDLPVEVDATVRAQITSNLPLSPNATVERTEHERIRESTQSTTYAIAKRLIELSQRANYRGLVIAIDDVQHWRVIERQKDNVRRSQLRGMLGVFNDSTVHEDSKLPVQLIVAGTSGTHRTVLSRTSGRRESGQAIYLTRVTDDDVVQVFRDNLNVVKPDGQVPASIPDAWLMKAARACHGHMLHVAQATKAVTEMAFAAAEQGRRVLEDDREEEFHEEIQQAIQLTYDERWDALEEDICNMKPVVRRLAMALDVYDNRLSEHNIDILLRSIRADLPPESLPDNLLTALRDANLIVHREPTNNYAYLNRDQAEPNVNGEVRRPTDFYTMPIPSFVTYINNQELNPEDQANIDNWWHRVHDKLSRHRIPAWRWDRTPKISRTETPKPYRPLVEHTLIPPLFADIHGGAITANEAEIALRAFHLKLDETRREEPTSSAD